jgi:hypothetical protein
MVANIDVMPIPNNSNADAGPVEIRAISINFTPNVGADDLLLAVRVVPDGREGKVLFGRTLRPDEVDDDRPIVIDATAGESLQFRPGSVRFSIYDADRYGETGPDGYKPITNTIWTWLSFGSPTQPALFRHLLAGARRLDGAHALLADMTRVITNLSGGFIGKRSQIYQALAMAEILIVSVGRTVDLLDGLATRFGVTVPLPPLIESKKAGIREMRNAFEHIEDRALGQVRGHPHPDALSVFEQRAFLSQGKLTYAAHSLDLRSELPQIMLTARQYVFEVASSVAGEARDMAVTVEFFKGNSSLG